jgi:hypothetical protein
MTPFTLCMAYYDNLRMWEMQIERISRLPDDLRGALKVIICDDGSPRWPAVPGPIGCALKIYRIDVDVPWNQDAARNICVRHSDTQWLLLTDMDHIVPYMTWDRLMRGKLDKAYCYKLQRTTLEPDWRETPYKPHPNTWVCTRRAYDEAGGYDERFAGHYGTDADFRDRLRVAAIPADLKVNVIRVPRETIPDASTTTLVRKSQQDGLAIRRIKEDRDVIHGWRPVCFSFPYHLVHSSP